MNIELTSSLISQKQFCTYRGFGNPIYIFEHIDEYWRYSEDLEYVWDNETFMIDWSQCVFKWLQNKIKTLGKDKINYEPLDVELKGYHSPKEYNFSSDELYFDLIVKSWTSFSKSVFKTIKPPIIKEKFKTYLADNYTSYDGFISFGSNNYKDWKEKFIKREVIEVGALIGFFMSELSEEDYGYVFESLTNNNMKKYFLKNE